MLVVNLDNDFRGVKLLCSCAYLMISLKLCIWQNKKQKITIFHVLGFLDKISFHMNIVIKNFQGICKQSKITWKAYKNKDILTMGQHWDLLETLLNLKRKKVTAIFQLLRKILTKHFQKPQWMDKCWILVTSLLGVHERALGLIILKLTINLGELWFCKCKFHINLIQYISSFLIFWKKLISSK